MKVLIWMLLLTAPGEKEMALYEYPTERACKEDAADMKTTNPKNKYRCLPMQKLEPKKPTTGEKK